jgi:hypothetical protein
VSPTQTGLGRVWVPYPHQEPMSALLARLPRAALYSGPGAGKTVVVATEVSESLFDRLETRKWLIVAPKSVAADTWHRECDKWAHLSYVKPRLLTFEVLGMKRARHANGDAAGLEFEDRAAVKRLLRGYPEPVHITDYSTFVWLVKALGVNFHYDGVVFDESGFLRDTDSQRFRAAKHAVNKLGVVRRVIELDGTPVPARYENLLAPFILLDQGERLGPTKTAFRSNWSEPDVVGRSGQVFSWRVRADKVAPIQAKIAELAVSSDRDIGVDLVESDHEVQLPAAARKLYDQMERDAIVKLDGVDILAANAAIVPSKLLQICNGFLFDGDRVVRAVHTAKLDAIVEAVEAAPGPVLLPYLFIPEGLALRKKLGKRLRFANEPGAIQAFREGAVPVLAFHPETMSHGIDGLQGASNTMLWFGVPYRFDWYWQSLKRIHRDGQRSSAVFVRRFIAAGTLEGRIIREVLEPRRRQNEALLTALRPKGTT